MSDDVLERIGVAVAQTGIQMSPEAVRVAVRVLLETLHAKILDEEFGGTPEGLPLTETDASIFARTLGLDLSEKEQTDE